MPIHRSSSCRNSQDFRMWVFLLWHISNGKSALAWKIALLNHKSLLFFICVLFIKKDVKSPQQRLKRTQEGVNQREPWGCCSNCFKRKTTHSRWAQSRKSLFTFKKWKTSGGVTVICLELRTALGSLWIKRRSNNRICPWKARERQISGRQFWKNYLCQINHCSLDMFCQKSFPVAATSKFINCRLTIVNKFSCSFINKQSYQ